MNFRENILAALRYQPYEKLPVVSFGYWEETLDKWAAEGYVTAEEAEGYRRFGDNSPADRSVMKKLGFDFNWNSCFSTNVLLDPPFETEVLEVYSDGSRKIRDSLGLICKEKPGVTSIPAMLGTSLCDRVSWETLYRERFRMHAGRINFDVLKQIPPPSERDIPIGLHVGSLMGNMRNILGVEGMSYLYADDETLYREIVDTMCGLCYDCAETVLKTGVSFDYAHFWEDVCFKNGPLISPAVAEELFGPWYRKITALLRHYGVDIVSLDCDGKIDALLPVWLENGVNTMFPIEVGTWNASIAPWRERFGREIRGVGGMNKTIFSQDREAVDREVERLRALVRLGGYIPCPDHRIAPDAKFELVQYYCDRMHNWDE